MWQNHCACPNCVACSNHEWNHQVGMLLQSKMAKDNCLVFDLPSKKHMSACLTTICKHHNVSFCNWRKLQALILLQWLQMRLKCCRNDVKLNKQFAFSCKRTTTWENLSSQQSQGFNCWQLSLAIAMICRTILQWKSAKCLLRSAKCWFRFDLIIKCTRPNHFSNTFGMEPVATMRHDMTDFKDNQWLRLACSHWTRHFAKSKKQICFFLSIGWTPGIFSFSMVASTLHFFHVWGACGISTAHQKWLLQSDTRPCGKLLTIFNSKVNAWLDQTMKELKQLKKTQTSVEIQAALCHF